MKLINFFHSRLTLVAITLMYFLLLSGQEAKSQDSIDVSSGYLEIFCPRNSDKSIPKVIFYVKGSYQTNSSEWVHLVEISKYEFQRLGKIIKEDTLLHKGESERYADFLIVQKRSQIAFFSKDRQSTIKLFDKILILFNKSKNIASIKEVLKAVESRLI